MSTHLTHPTAAARRFLQTVVVIDDHAYTPPSDEFEESASLGADDPGVEEDLVGEDENAVPDPEDIDTEAVVGGFADMGVSCSVVDPGSSVSGLGLPRLLALAERADVVVLDWVIAGPELAEGESAGRLSAPVTSVELLATILRIDSERGSRLRMICVYTGDRNVLGVVDKIAERLRRDSANVRVDEDARRIDVAHARVVVLAKQGRFPVPGLTTIAEQELAQTVLGEFSRFASDGFLPQIALSSLAVIREQAHLLLGRFVASLDPALIAHRALTTPQDAEQFALNLVGDELASLVLADSRDVVASLSATEVAAAIVLAHEGRSEAMYWPSFSASVGPKAISRVDSIQVLSEGVGKDNTLPSTGKKLARETSLTSLLLSGDSSVVRAGSVAVDLQFSALSSLARDVGVEGENAPPPVLQLGSILVRNSSAEAEPPWLVKTTYWICLQPLCDSVRLKPRARFPLLPLAECGANSPGFDFVVKDPIYRRLEIESLKFNAVRFVEFDPDVVREVVVAKREGGHWVFHDSSGQQFKWLGDLRLDKSHRIANLVVNDAGRIGISEYELLRRVSGR